MEDLDEIKKNLKLQLEEVEAVSSMFLDEEFEWDNPSCKQNIELFLKNHIDYDILRERLGFTLKLSSEDSADKRVELSINLPHHYPKTCPSCSVRLPNISRSIHEKFNKNLQSYINQLEEGELKLMDIIDWCRQKCSSIEEENPTPQSPKSKVTECEFSTLWMYSHHIYSKFKRRDILAFSDELNLTGFSMPGKPGIICIEGSRDSVDEFWKRLRRMQWQRLMQKERTDVKCSSYEEMNKMRKFGDFQEMGRSHLLPLLKSKGLENIFSLYFGVDGTFKTDE
ncbi:DgyrCDS2069 [Dimorphilus gyrociliatus]|uniref:DgyrCDS2069 n=1 Tax=Dimorphilus gyrociliatus TaxID=2664684 RepID=A0A7I8V9D1_9ANNE|nr:DgyrCDS2069 [Dimorphilus gyrociliatus]